MNKNHHYSLLLKWTGNTGSGTSAYRAYERSYKVIIDGKADLHCSSDPAFRGDSSKHNPEELFVASISSCHMLWYLHLCADAGIIVLNYADDASGIMEETSNDGGKFIGVTLKPKVLVQDAASIAKAIALHKRANELCFIANSCNFPIYHQPIVIAQGQS